MAGWTLKCNSNKKENYMLNMKIIATEEGLRNGFSLQVVKDDTLLHSCPVTIPLSLGGLNESDMLVAKELAIKPFDFYDDAEGELTNKLRHILPDQITGVQVNTKTKTHASLEPICE